jgi:hypothetical protein
MDDKFFAYFNDVDSDRPNYCRKIEFFNYLSRDLPDGVWERAKAQADNHMKAFLEKVKGQR